MSSLLFGSIVHQSAVPADEKVVRMTTAPVTLDTPPAMADNPPDTNEVETDPNPTLGMSTRQVASTWVQGEKYSPPWKGDVDAADEHNAIVDRQVSSSGTAAAREAAGEFGHGRMSYAYGIEPVTDLRDGGRFGNEYFAADKRNVQTGAGDYMTVPPGSDQSTTTKVSAAGKDAAKDATAAAYRTFWEGFQRG